ncbi:hypothetical protein [Actinacidiphila oryziradicis]|uniref:Uncharacterized protein n=1 Tax=Actinacidiphila oryziradicis TaxID=2571141 RepID=A0A4U0RVQ3_9ACTN|nr:hypothetical protein [Actinacidiphila oryziradicis]TJZ99596.1 hypothetical protein FCI23_45115 [Actinacidiphila oryziradicis]
MSTDIHGGIEFRHPGVGTDYEGEPWIAAMDLWPLYDQTDYAAFGCLFGVRNYAGFRPLAAGRGLPSDLSSGLRAQLESSVAAGDLTGASWVSWKELARLDLTSTPDHFVGRLTWSTMSSPSLLHQQLVPSPWPPDVLAAVGQPPPELDLAAHGREWTTTDLHCRYEPLAAGAVLGEGSHWPHVFTVMRALADRFGEETVRLVVTFN